MRKIIFFVLFVFVFGFDIDEYDRGLHALREENFKEAFEIFYLGCEINDDLACEELGLMYANNQVSHDMDVRVGEIGSFELALRYLMKSCKIGYLNACDDIVSLANENKVSDEILSYAKSRYIQLASEFIEDDNATK